nr:hypothetical protein CFP56_21653 [Quercus suber]
MRGQGWSGDGSLTRKEGGVLQFGSADSTGTRRRTRQEHCKGQRSKIVATAWMCTVVVYRDTLIARFERPAGRIWRLETIDPDTHVAAFHGA